MPWDPQPGDIAVYAGGGPKYLAYYIICDATYDHKVLDNKGNPATLVAIRIDGGASPHGGPSPYLTGEGFRNAEGIAAILRYTGVNISDVLRNIGVMLEAK